MSVRVTWADPTDVARCIDALLAAAEAAELQHAPLLARRYRAIADDLGDALDRGLPEPSGWSLFRRQQRGRGR